MIVAYFNALVIMFIKLPRVVAYVEHSIQLEAPEKRQIHLIIIFEPYGYRILTTPLHKNRTHTGLTIITDAAIR